MIPDIEKALALTQRLYLLSQYRPRKRKARRSNRAKRKRIVKTLMRMQ